MQRTLLPLLLFFLFLNISISAQNDVIIGDAEGKRPINGAVYNLSDPTTLNIRVSLLGFVMAPGKYIIPQKTNLLDLIAFGGGPKEGADAEKIKIFRKNANGQTFILEYNYLALFEDEMDQMDRMPTDTPVILPGDIVVIPGSTTDVYRLVYIGLQILNIIISLVFFIISN